MGGTRSALRLGRLLLGAASLGFALTAGAQTSAPVRPAESPAAARAASEAASAVAAAKAAAAVQAAKAAAASAAAASSPPSQPAAAPTPPASAASDPKSPSADPSPPKSPEQAASAPAGQCPTSGAAYCLPIDNGWVLLVVLLYAAAFALARWHFVARPHLHSLDGQIENIRQWMLAHPRPAGSTAPGDDRIEALLTQAEKLTSPGKIDLIDKVLWSRGQDSMSLRLLYQAREMLTPREAPESLRAALEAAAKSLASGDADEQALALRIKEELDNPPMDVQQAGPALMQELRAYLSRFDTELDDEVQHLVTANGGAKPPTPQAAQALLVRVSTALLPPPALVRRLASAATLPGAWQVLAEHAHDVALPAAMARHQALQPLATASPAPTVDACLAALESTREVRRALQGLAARLAVALAAAPLLASERRVVLVNEVLGLMHFKNLVEYDKQFTWHRKNYWLGLSSLALLLLLASAAGNALLFLVGAFGGLLSRLRLAVTTGGTRDSEDLHWTTIFLSPVMGALAAWGGMLLISLGLHFQLLGKLFEPLVWSAPLSPALLGVALMLGFAERLFLDVAQRIQSKLGSAAQEAKTGK